MHYLKGAFIFDLLAVLAWPLSYAMKGAIDPDYADLIYLLRLFRLSKILILMDIQQFKQMVRGRFRNVLTQKLQNVRNLQ